MLFIIEVPERGSPETMIMGSVCVVIIV